MLYAYPWNETNRLAIQSLYSAGTSMSQHDKILASVNMSALDGLTENRARAVTHSASAVSHLLVGSITCNYCGMEDAE